MTEYTLIIKGKPVRTGSLILTVIEFERCVKMGVPVAYLPCAIETKTLYGFRDGNQFFERESMSNGIWTIRVHEINFDAIKSSDCIFMAVPYTFRGKQVININGNVMPVRAFNFHKFEVEA